MPDQEIPDQNDQVLLLGAYVLHLIAEANGGQEPQNIWQYRRAALRFGVRIRILPPGVLPAALLRQGQNGGEQGVIYASATYDRRKFRRVLLHELGEAATRWEGVPPVVCQTTRHEVARCVEEMCFRRV